ncbi:hypothetical protein C7974DRAFT_403060 [Boeremia exigua]|uniref:uncharacterized protein n=1 Tax=Boeremia exigua TaxID=749465 RepID=UPI001E8E916A|nr:uncharacterized protein C7974DRAFT_403060 [Boeremia exigua]KAH6614997.1 hypothetical protein C7974DRAFT_403060 [Boeremia exigua]
MATLVGLGFAVCIFWVLGLVVDGRVDTEYTTTSTFAHTTPILRNIGTLELGATAYVRVATSLPLRLFQRTAGLHCWSGRSFGTQFSPSTSFPFLMPEKELPKACVPSS